MGIDSSAYLIFGIPVERRNEDGELTQHWSEEDEYWRKVDGDLRYVPYGHYENSDDILAILTTKRVPWFTGYCWGPTRIPSDAFTVSDKALSKATDDARASGLDVSFYGPEAGWYLVASVG